MCGSSWNCFAHPCKSLSKTNSLVVVKRRVAITYIAPADCLYMG